MILAYFKSKLPSGRIYHMESLPALHTSPAMKRKSHLYNLVVLIG